MTKFSFLMAAATLSLMSTVGHAIEIRSGEYAQADHLVGFNNSNNGISFNSDPAFDVSRGGSMLFFFDKVQKIKYSFDLSKTTEQELPSGYYEYLHRRTDIPGLVFLLDKITVDHLVESNNQIRGNLNLYVDTKNGSAIFGRASAKIVIPGVIYMSKCTQEINTFTSNRTVNTKTEVPCFKVRTLTPSMPILNISVVGFQLNELERFKNLAGLILDFALKLAPIAQTDTLIRLPRM